MEDKKETALEGPVQEQVIRNIVINELKNFKRIQCILLLLLVVVIILSLILTIKRMIELDKLKREVIILKELLSRF